MNEITEVTLLQQEKAKNTLWLWWKTKNAMRYFRNAALWAGGFFICNNPYAQIAGDYTDLNFAKVHGQGISHCRTHATTESFQAYDNISTENFFIIPFSKIAGEVNVVLLSLFENDGEYDVNEITLRWEEAQEIEGLRLELSSQLGQSFVNVYSNDDTCSLL